MIDIATLKQQHRLDDIVEACGHHLTPVRNGIRRGWHCDRHRDEFELTVFVNHGHDGYFVCNRCGLRGDVIAWVGFRLFGTEYNPRDGHQLREIAAFLEETIVTSSLHPPAVQKQAATNALPGARWVSTAHRRLLTDLRCDAHRQYLASRGIHLAHARRWQLGTFKMEVVIPVFEAGALRAVVKRRIDRKEYHVLGQGDGVLFNVDALQDADQVLICEAPFDAIIAAEELPGWAVVSPIAGCRSWPDTYTEPVKAKARVVIGYDNDVPGNDAALFLFRLFPFASRLQLPLGMDIGDARVAGLDPFAQLADGLFRQSHLPRDDRYSGVTHSSPRVTPQ